MKTIGYDSIQNILLSITDPNTGGATYEVPGVSSPKINGGTSIYNNQSGDGLGIAGWSTDVRWTAGVGSISWSSGNIDLPDGTQVQVSSGSATVSAPTYIYVDTTDGTVGYTTHSYDAVGKDKIMICAAFPNSGKNVTFQSFGNADQNSLTTGSSIANGTITANNIATGTITANQIASGTITANEIAGNTITASEIASGAIDTAELAAGAVTAGKIDVSYLSAISADLGSITAGDITGTTITAGSTSSAGIKLYPSGSTGYLDFYYNGSRVGRIQGQYVSGVGNTVAITGSSIALNGDVYCLETLRIPVGTNLYN